MAQVGRRGIHEDEVLPLCETFLSTVHTRNPVLDETALLSEARRIAEHGLQWDSQSCLVVCFPLSMEDSLIECQSFLPVHLRSARLLGSQQQFRRKIQNSYLSMDHLRAKRKLRRTFWQLKRD